MRRLLISLILGATLLIFLFCSDNNPASPDTITYPTAITDLVILGDVDTSADLAWSAPTGKDNRTVKSYDIRYAADSAILATWTHASSLPAPPTPKTPETSETVHIGGLSLDSNYYFGIKSIDSSGSVSDLSNIVFKDYGFAPKVIMIQPADGDSVADLVYLEALVGDDKGVTEVEFWVDAGRIGTVKAPPFGMWWNSNPKIDGTNHSIYARAKDSEGNGTNSKVITVTIDTLLGVPNEPEVRTISPSDSGLDISWAPCFDPDFEEYVISWDEDSLSNTARWTEHINNPVDTSMFLPMPWDNTYYPIKIVTHDEFGRTSSVDTSYYRIDIAPPTLSHVTVSGYLDQTSLISWDSSEINDFDHYQVYRSADINADPSDLLICTIYIQDSTVIVDETTPDQLVYYYVVVTDRSDNSSGFEMIAFDYSALSETDYAIEFDGNSDFMDIPYFDEGLGSPNYTVEMWLKPYANLGHSIAFGQRLWAMELDINYDGYHYFVQGSCEIQIHRDKIPADSWTHLAYSFDVPTQTFRLYINGQIEFESNCARITDPHSLRFGARQDPLQYYFAGAVDDLRIWNYVRSESEIVSHMNSKFYTIPDGLVGYYPMNEGEGNTLPGKVGPTSTFGFPENGDTAEPSWIYSDRL